MKYETLSLNSTNTQWTDFWSVSDAAATAAARELCLRYGLRFIRLHPMTSGLGRTFEARKDLTASSR